MAVPMPRLKQRIRETICRGAQANTCWALHQHAWMESCCAFLQPPKKKKGERARRTKGLRLRMIVVVNTTMTLAVSPVHLLCTAFIICYAFIMHWPQMHCNFIVYLMCYDNKDSYVNVTEQKFSFHLKVEMEMYAEFWTSSLLWESWAGGTLRRAATTKWLSLAPQGMERVRQMFGSASWPITSW